MSGYSVFSEFYDILQQSADYDGRTEYILQLFEKYDRRPTLMLDFACGTGEFSLRFTEYGIQVIGADPSPDMLSIAAGKGERVLYLCQDGASLELYGTVDGAVCLLDSINHIIDETELQKAFNNIALYLERDRLFIFDVNSVYKHQNILGDNAFSFETDEVFCVWQNTLSKDGVTVDIDLDFFVEEKDGRYARLSESFSERAYTDDELRKMLESAGFEVLDILGDMSFTAARDNEERKYFIAKRK